MDIFELYSSLFCENSKLFVSFSLFSKTCEHHKQHATLVKKSDDNKFIIHSVVKSTPYITMTEAVGINSPKFALSQMNPKLIRQVLLTDQSQFSSLRVSDAPRITPTIEEFEAEQLQASSSSPQATMKRAFVDHLVERQDMKGLHSLVLTLHTQLRALVPNRKDLHSLVNDEDVQNTNTPVELLPLLVRASQCLESLESEARVETTAAWRRKAQQQSSASAEYVVTSTLYLLYKVDLTQADKQDFYLQQIWAPLIHVEGSKYLRTVLDKQYGVDDYKLTKEWIRDLAMNSTVQDPKERRTMLRKGWVETILFRKTAATTLPEVFSLDVDTLQTIRHVCKRAVACCALALHASGGDSNKLKEQIEATSEVGLRRADLVQAMGDNSSPTYEEDVSAAVVALAKTWSSLSNEQSLRNRTVTVLRGQDPVIQLLDRRMQEVFVGVVTDDSALSPSELRSGTAVAPSTTNPASTQEQRKAEAAFRNKGLSFQDSELATLSITAKKIVDLVWVLHQDVIDKAFNQAEIA
jgi:hypothetical protein